MSPLLANAPLSTTLDAVRGHLPPALVAPAARAAVEGVARTLPAALTRELYLECRLAAGDSRVDLVLHVTGAGRDVASGANPVIGLPRDLIDRPAWRRVRAFCAEWSRPDSPLYRAVSGVWLEMDLDPPSSGLPEPGVFVNLRWLGERGTAAEEWTAAASDALGRLTGRSISTSAANTVTRCVRALPAGATMTYAGAFPGRGAGPVRLCAWRVPAARLPAYLAEAGWPGDTSEAASMAAEVFGGGGAPGYVHLDVGDDGEVGQRLGIEVPLHRRTQLDGEIRELALLERLAAAGLCAPEKADALAAWPGWTEAVLPHQPWPSLLVRRVNHLKLVLERGRDTEAKAYLCAFHTHRRGAARRAPEG